MLTEILNQPFLTSKAVGSVLLVVSMFLYHVASFLSSHFLLISLLAVGSDYYKEAGS